MTTAVMEPDEELLDENVSAEDLSDMARSSGDYAEVVDSEPRQFMTLAQARDHATRDPGPSWADDQPQPKEKREAPKLTKKQKDDIEGKVNFWLELISMPFVPLDPYCIPVMQQNIPNIAKKATPILCQSPEVVAWLTKAGNFALWADLFMACMPVIKMIVAHHVMHTVGQRMTTDQAQAQRAAQQSMYVVE